MTTLRLQLKSARLPPPVLQEFTRALQADINRNVDARAEVPDAPVEGHHKGEPITLGVLAVTFLSSGAAVALFNVLKAYVERDQSVTISVEMPDGTKKSLTASNLGDAREMAQMLRVDAAG